MGQSLPPTLLGTCINIAAGYGHTVAIRAEAAPCFGDLDGSGEIDTGDVAVILLDYGVCVGCPSDLDDSTIADSGDISLVLLNFGLCP